MTFLSELLGMLAFRAQAPRSLAERGALALGVVLFSIGYLAYAFVRNSVYADLPEVLAQRSGLVGSFWDLHFVQVLFFLLLIYIPALIVLSKALAGYGLGLSVSRKKYGAHGSVLLTLWGTLYLITAPVQWLLPHFFIIGMLEISFGMLIRLMLVSAYTMWAIKQLNNLPQVQAFGVFVLSWFTLPIYYFLISI
jgi:hypothetical protein